MADAIHGGHLWALEWEYPVLTERAVNPDIVKDVGDILDMWDLIELSVEGLSPENREKVVKNEEAGPFGTKFTGFDGNNEASHMSVARFLVEKMDRWQRFKGRNFNSHMPTLDAAHRMLNVYEPIRAQTGRLSLPRMTSDQVIAVLREKIHPEHREYFSDVSWRMNDDLRARLEKSDRA